MFFKTSQKRFPNLCVYAQFAAERQKALAEEIAGAGLVTAGGLSLSAGLAAGIFFANPLLGVLLGLAGLTSGAFGWTTLKKARQNKDRIGAEAAEATTLLLDALKRGKLHRITGDATTMLLEESARHWARVHQALQSPFWSSPNLPLHYASVRDQAERAADRAMDEAVVMMHGDIEAPYRSGMADRTSLADVVEGVFGVQIPDTTRPVPPLPVAFKPVRQLAEKLKDLADNVESLTLEVAKDPAVQGEFQAETALDLCISEVQSIRQAETELRQNLRG